MKRTVDSILAAFKKTITALDKCEQENNRQADSCAVKAALLERACESHAAEADRARKVRMKLEELIGE